MFRALISGLLISINDFSNWIAFTLRRLGIHLPHAARHAAEPRDLNDGWPVSTPLKYGIDDAGLADLYRLVAKTPQFSSIFSLLISREGQLIGEGYFRGNGSRGLINVKSVTKSVLSLLVGIALDRGDIGHIDEELGAFFPWIENDKGGKRRITVGDLLRMQAGLEWDEWADGYGDARGMFGAADSLAYVLDKPLLSEPGTYFCYSTGTSQLLAGILHAASGLSPHDFAQAYLFSPLGIEDTFWVAGQDGLNFGGTHLFLTPRQMLKIGQLCLQLGSWQGERVVSADWIVDSTRIHAGRDWWEGPYGYHWWVRPQGYCAYGYGGQIIYVIPQEDLVVVMTAHPDSRSHIPLLFFEKLLLEQLSFILRSQLPSELATSH